MSETKTKIYGSNTHERAFEMKAKIATSALEWVLSVVKTIISNRTPIPVYQTVRLEFADNRIVAETTSGHSYLRVSTPAEVEEPGTANIDCSKLHKWCSALDSETVSLSLTGDNRFLAKSRSSRATLPITLADPFGELASDERQNLFGCAVGDLIPVLSESLTATTKEYAQPLFTGVHMRHDGLVRFASVDGFRVTERALPLSSLVPGSMTIPGDSVKAIISILKDAIDENVVFSTSDSNHLIVTSGTITFITSLMSGDFPHFWEVVPSEFETIVTLEREAVASALVRVSQIGDSVPLRLSVVPDTETPVENAATLTLKTSESNGSIGEESLLVDYTGSDVQMIVNKNFLGESLKNARPDFVQFKFAHDRGLYVSEEDSSDYDFIVQMLL